MTTTPNTGITKNLRNIIHVALVGTAAIVLYNMFSLFTKAYSIHEDEAVSFALTAGFLGGIYAGRFIALYWSNKNSSIPNWLFVALPVVVISCLFFCVLFANSLRSHWEIMFMLFFTLPFFILSITLGMLIKLGRIKVNRQLLEAHTSAAHSESELHILQAQLSPHFLFNTLNNLYGLSITHHEKIPPLLLKLSELLRYSVYDVKELFVPLKDELKYISNFIAFETLRIGDRLKLTCDIEKVEDAGVKIAPMLLIVYIENAFKHSRNTGDKEIHIDIAIQMWGNSVLFSVRNSIGQTKAAADDINVAANGFGLVNARRRLELLYPGQFDLQISQDAQYYQVMLRLNAK